MKLRRAGGIFLCLCLASIIFGGCATPQPRRNDLYVHAIRFDRDGYTVDPRNGRRFTAAETIAQFQKILDTVDSEMARDDQKRILIFIHGGMNSPDYALDTAANKIDAITADNYYPIFVIWDSSLTATYGEHLFAIRQGRKDADTRSSARFTWPLYLSVDLLRSIARAPAVWLQQRHTDDQAISAALDSMFTEAAKNRQDKQENPQHAQAWMSHPRNVEALSIYLELNRRYARDCAAHGGHPTTQMAISIGTDQSQFSDWLGRGTIYFVTLPAKMFFAPLIDALGSAAWENMSRRTQTILEGSDDFTVDRHTTPEQLSHYIDHGTDGGLDAFIAALAKRASIASARAAGASSRNYQITLIGHSMGSMVINEVLHRQLQRESSQGAGAVLPVTNIVYMAAACSVRDFRNAVVPFMQSENHNQTRFYSLSLHPTAELLESNYGDLPPRGSLLVWIDNFLSDPATPLDCTLGRWANLVGVPYVIPPEMRGRVSIKAFDVLRNPDDGPRLGDPQRHGDFTQVDFWKQDFWTPLPPQEELSPTLRAAQNKQREMQRRR